MTTVPRNDAETDDAGLSAPHAPWWRWAVLAAIGFGLVVGLYVAAVQVRLGARFEDSVLQGRQLKDSWFHGAVLRRAVRHSLIPLACGAGLAFAVAAWRRRWHQAVGAAVLVAVNFGAAEAIKHFVIGERPIDSQLFGGDNSYPSGHTAAALAVAMGLVLVAPQRFRGKVAAAVAVCAMVVANGTLAIGWHRPSDAIASCGLTVVSFVAVVATMWALGWARPARPGRASRLSVATWPLGAGGLAAAVWGLWRLKRDLSALRDHVVTNTGELVHMFFTGDVLTVGAVALAMAMALIALQGVSFDLEANPIPVADD